MSPVLEQLPLLVAAAALILGILLGKKLASVHTGKAVRIVALVGLGMLIACNSGGLITTWSIDRLAALGMDISFARYTGVALLSFLSGLGFAFIISRPASTPSA